MPIDISPTHYLQGADHPTFPPCNAPCTVSCSGYLGFSSKFSYSLSKDAGLMDVGFRIVRLRRIEAAANR